MKMWIVNLSLFGLILKLALGDEVLLDIPQGTLRGLKTTTAFHGKTFYSFKSIPYAKPNIGLNKFRPPEPAGGWKGVRDATKFGSSCVQLDTISLEIFGDDDCLFVNVYTPDLNKFAKRAVIIFIHGGAFNFGNGDDTFYGPDFLVENDLVMVTFNYRLGATGFLNTGDANAPGNAGMKDQVMAMRWVQDYIEYFSGSPSRVTLFGQSVGATSVQYHLLSPMSHGLFSAAIIDSGTVAASYAISYTPLEDAYVLADALSVEANCTEELVKKLAQIPTMHIVEALYKLYPKMNLQSGELWLMRPSLETDFGQEKFLPGPPWELVKSGKIADVPIIFGMLTDNAKIFTLIDLPKKVEFTCDYEKYIPSDLNITNPERKKCIGDAVKKFYFHDQPNECNIKEEFPNLLSDVYFWRGTALTSKIIQSRISSPVYLFLFSYYTPFGFFKSDWNADGGVVHGDELQFLFYSTYFKNKPEPCSETEQKTYEMVEMWTDFAKERNPSATMKYAKVKWEPLGDEDNYLDIGDDLVMKKSLWKDRVDLWVEISKDVLGDYVKLFECNHTHHSNVITRILRILLK